MDIPLEGPPQIPMMYGFLLLMTDGVFMGLGVYDLNFTSAGENIIDSLPERCLRVFLPDWGILASMRPDVVFGYD